MPAFLRSALAAASLVLTAGAPSPAGVSAALPVVAIIDSGVARTPELAPLLLAEYDAAGTPGRAPYRPRYDHGTMVATILARAAAMKVRLISLRIDDPVGCPAGVDPPCQPDAAPIAAAIRRAALGVDAINISMNLAEDPAIVAAVREAAQRGIAVVMAAGNEGQAHPANLAIARAGYPKALLVGALDAAGRPWRGTNRPDGGRDYAYAWQRGVDVPTALIDGRQVLGTGTSFAAPIETARLLAKPTSVAPPAPPPPPKEATG